MTPEARAEVWELYDRCERRAAERKAAATNAEGRAPDRREENENG